MAPSAVPVDVFPTAHDEAEVLRPLKRTKTELTHSITESQLGEDGPDAIPPHPLGVKPLGNAYTTRRSLKASAGSFKRLPDELLVHFLEYLEAVDLLKLGGTCKALYAFTRFEDLWKTLFVESPPQDFTWRGTWRSTYLCLPLDLESRISCVDLFSDVLHRPFYCAHVPLRSYATNIPPQNAIPRLPDLTVEEFSADWTNTPFILTSPVKSWPIYGTWTTTSLLQTYASTLFRAEAVDWPLATYISYMRNNTDESPLYLFDRSFAAKMSLSIGPDAPDASYWPPSCFGADLFSVLGDQRPDSRWLIIGPARSGSTFHKDPNATSAWNAVLTGAKYWLMFPPSVDVPGVFVSADGGEVTSPLSIAEYLLSFHALARRTPGCREGVCWAGEVLHVPSGWFHLVLNLEESIALTGNFVPRARVADALGFLRDQGANVSGFRDDVKDPYGLLVEKLGEKYPAVLDEGLRELEKKTKGKRGKWEELVKGDEDGDADDGGFSFGFGGDEEEVE
ncbi:hypothetical protein W97_03548 [Coniosporium apollinis CBS 100218]|uniref:Uncharacterized protein n=1 Tax=Coniosporium apollinis (strain CBS 100218) TaxID=1168221 RepID=R7YQX6_CONA1|nr:uncharacterized protein W97_03548 [Coniosporium apollinis CBS 100218]EON64317.1 hypothetical protein W97_03548 [Coniosporium apollinis CBS 100218]